MARPSRTSSGSSAKRATARTQEAARVERNRALVAGAALVAAVVLVYSHTLACGFIWDDDYYVENNEVLRSLGGLGRIWGEPSSLPQYYPLVHTTFWGEYHLWGLHPAGYHLTNVLLHAAAALLLWRVLVRLQVPGALLGAAIFALHPIEVESVAWITERKNVLSAVLALASLLAFLRFAPTEPTAERQETFSSRGRRGPYMVSFIMFLAALLSKTVTASLPAVLLVIYWWKRGRLTRHDVVPLVPFILSGVALSGATVYIEKHQVGAQGAAWDLSIVERFLIAGRALWFYAGKLAAPVDLNFFYPRWSINVRNPAAYIYPFAALGVMIALWFARRRIGRGPLTAVLIFAGVLVPALGFFNVYPFRYSFVADHFQYHAGMALIAMAAAAATFAARRLGSSTGLLSIVGVASVLGVLGALTYARTKVYDDQITLFESVVAADSESWIGHHNLGELRLRQGDVPAALTHLSAAVKINPDNLEAYLSLARAMSEVGEHGKAIEVLERALQVPDVEPALRAAAENNLASILSTCPEPALRDPRRAVELAQAALRGAPNAPALYNTLGIAEYRAALYEQAIASLSTSMKLRNGGDSSDRFFTAMAYWQLHDQAAARRWFIDAERWRQTHEPHDPDAARFEIEAATLLGSP